MQAERRLAIVVQRTPERGRSLVASDGLEPPLALLRTIIGDRSEEFGLGLKPRAVLFRGSVKVRQLDAVPACLRSARRLRHPDLVLATTLGDERGGLGTERVIGAIRGDQRLPLRVRQYQ